MTILDLINVLRINVPFEVVLVTIIWILIPILALSLYSVQQNERKKLKQKNLIYLSHFG